MIELTNEGTENDGATMKQTDAVADVNGDGETTIMTEMNPPPTAQMSFREKQNELRRDRGRFYTVRVENLSFDATAGDVQNMFEHMSIVAQFSEAKTTKNRETMVLTDILFSRVES